MTYPSRGRSRRARSGNSLLCPIASTALADRRPTRGPSQDNNRRALAALVAIPGRVCSRPACPCSRTRGHGIFSGAGSQTRDAGVAALAAAGMVAPCHAGGQGGNRGSHGHGWHDCGTSAQGAQHAQRALELALMRGQQSSVDPGEPLRTNGLGWGPTDGRDAIP